MLTPPGSANARSTLRNSPPRTKRASACLRREIAGTELIGDAALLAGAGGAVATIPRDSLMDNGVGSPGIMEGVIGFPAQRLIIV